MTVSDYKFVDRDHPLRWGMLFSSRRKRRKVLTPFGWFTVLAVIAFALGTAWGFAT